MEQTTLHAALYRLTEIHGSQTEAAQQCGIEKSYFSRLLSGEKEWPSDEVLRRMGLKRIVTYVWLKEPR